MENKKAATHECPTGTVAAFLKGSIKTFNNYIHSHLKNQWLFEATGWVIIIANMMGLTVNVALLYLLLIGEVTQ